MWNQQLTPQQQQQMYVQQQMYLQQQQQQMAMMQQQQQQQQQQRAMAPQHYMQQQHYLMQQQQQQQMQQMSEEERKKMEQKRKLQEFSKAKGGAKLSVDSVLGGLAPSKKPSAAQDNSFGDFAAALPAASSAQAAAEPAPAFAKASAPNYNAFSEALASDQSGADSGFAPFASAASHQPQHQTAPGGTGFVGGPGNAMFGASMAPAIGSASASGDFAGFTSAPSKSGSTGPDFSAFAAAASSSHANSNISGLSGVPSSSVFGGGSGGGGGGAPSSVFGGGGAPSSVFGSSGPASSIFGSSGPASSVFGGVPSSSSAFGSIASSSMPANLPSSTTPQAALFGSSISSSSSGFGAGFAGGPSGTEASADFSAFAAAPPPTLTNNMGSRSAQSQAAPAADAEFSDFASATSSSTAAPAPRMEAFNADFSRATLNSSSAPMATPPTISQSLGFPSASAASAPSAPADFGDFSSASNSFANFSSGLAPAASVPPAAAAAVSSPASAPTSTPAFTADFGDFATSTPASSTVAPVSLPAASAATAASTSAPTDAFEAFQLAAPTSQPSTTSGASTSSMAAFTTASGPALDSADAGEKQKDLTDLLKQNALLDSPGRSRKTFAKAEKKPLAAVTPTHTAVEHKPSQVAAVDYSAFRELQPDLLPAAADDFAAFEAAPPAVTTAPNSHWTLSAPAVADAAAPFAAAFPSAFGATAAAASAPSSGFPVAFGGVTASTNAAADDDFGTFSAAPVASFQSRPAPSTGSFTGAATDLFASALTASQSHVAPATSFAPQLASALSQASTGASGGGSTFTPLAAPPPVVIKLPAEPPAYTLVVEHKIGIVVLRGSPVAPSVSVAATSTAAAPPVATLDADFGDFSQAAPVPHDDFGDFSSSTPAASNHNLFPAETSVPSSNTSGGPAAKVAVSEPDFAAFMSVLTSSSGTTSNTRSNSVTAMPATAQATSSSPKTSAGQSFGSAVSQQPATAAKQNKAAALPRAAPPARPFPAEFAAAFQDSNTPASAKTSSASGNWPASTTAVQPPANIQAVNGSSYSNDHNHDDFAGFTSATTPTSATSDDFFSSLRTENRSSAQPSSQRAAQEASMDGFADFQQAAPSLITSADSQVQTAGMARAGMSSSSLGSNVFAQAANPEEDKYGAFAALASGDDTNNSSDPAYETFRELLECCLVVMQQAYQALTAILASPERKQLQSHPKTEAFTQGLLEVWKVAQRVMASGEDPQRSPPPPQALLVLFKRVRDTWLRLQPTLQEFPAASRQAAAADTNQVPSLQPADPGHRCSVCLQPAATDADGVLHLYGRRYHAPCANLWCNRVKPLLPTLAPPAS